VVCRGPPMLRAFILCQSIQLLTRRLQLTVFEALLWVFQAYIYYVLAILMFSSCQNDSLFMDMDLNTKVSQAGMLLIPVSMVRLLRTWSTAALLSQTLSHGVRQSSSTTRPSTQSLHIWSLCLLCLYMCILLFAFSDFFLRSFFLQYFDTVGWVFWPVKTISHMTYTVLAGT